MFEYKLNWESYLCETQRRTFPFADAVALMAVSRASRDSVSNPKFLSFTAALVKK